MISHYCKQKFLASEKSLIQALFDLEWERQNHECEITEVGNDCIITDQLLGIGGEINGF